MEFLVTPHSGQRSRAVMPGNALPCKATPGRTQRAKVANIPVTLIGLANAGIGAMGREYVDRYTALVTNLLRSDA